MYKSLFAEKRLIYVEVPRPAFGAEVPRSGRDAILQQTRFRLSLEKLAIDLPGNAARILREVTHYEPEEIIKNPTALKFALIDLAQCVENDILNREQCLTVLNALGIPPATVMEVLTTPPPLRPSAETTEPKVKGRLTLDELRKDPQIAALRRKLGPASFDTAVKVERLLTDHPDWRVIIKDAIDEFFGIQEDNPAYPRVFAMVQMIIWKESGGNPNMDDSRTWGQTVRTFRGVKAKFTTSACGLTGSRAASEGTQAFICEEAAKDPSIFANIPELKALPPADRIARYRQLSAEKRKLIAKRVLKGNPRIALRHGVKHLRELGGKGVARMPFNQGYFTINVGPGNVKAFERYVAQNPTPENYDKLPGFAELPDWARELTKVKRDNTTVMLPVAVRRYEYAQQSGLLGAMILRVQSLEDKNPELYALIAGKAPAASAVATASPQPAALFTKVALNPPTFKYKKVAAKMPPPTDNYANPVAWVEGNTPSSQPKSSDILMPASFEDDEKPNSLGDLSEVRALRDGVLVAVQEIQNGRHTQYRCRVVYKGYDRNGRPIIDPDTGEQKRFRKTYVIDKPSFAVAMKITDFQTRMETEGAFDPEKRIWHTTETTVGKTQIAKGEKLGKQLIVQAERQKKRHHKTG